MPDAAPSLRSEDVAALIRAYRKGGPLEREFYLSPAVFALDMARVFGRWWLFAGHSCSIPEPGDWFTWSIGLDSVIVIRGEDGEIRAFHNTCRHRGSRICTSETGRGPRLICPYHHWSYGLDGGCLVDTKDEFGADPAVLGLHPVRLENAAGLLFISLADAPPDFTAARDEIARRLKPHGLERAKIAHSIDYEVEANWKLIFENNRECYHCPGAHKEYTVATYDVARDMAAAKHDRVRQAALETIVEEANARFAAMGLDTGNVLSTMTGSFFRAHRTPLMKGFVTQSLDGKPVAPVMGELPEHDVGTLRTTVFPNFWQHASGDHAVATRITPTGPTHCRIRVTWLVDKEAVEGRDYTLDRLLPLWKLTSEQDWEICTWNQQGVSSSRYRPGRYSLTREYNVAHFVEWYLGEISR
jgi:glycine betaine monooxygenase A